MRRLLRDVAEQRPLGDTTTLADPAVVSEIQKRAESEQQDDSCLPTSSGRWRCSSTTRPGT